MAPHPLPLPAALAAALALAVAAASPAGAQGESASAVLPAPGPHRVLVHDPAYGTPRSGKVFVVDGDGPRLLGMVDAAYYASHVAPLDPAGPILVAETFWSRGARGLRTDVVTFWDPFSLEAAGEVALPAGRFLVAPKKPNAALTTDGRYLLSFNMTPSTSVSVVDVPARRYVGEVDTPGCVHVYPTGPASFASLCADGSFAQVAFDEAGRSELVQGEPFFDSDEDPVFEHPALHRPSGRAFFVSYEGWAHPVTLAGGRAAVGARFRLAGGEAEGWRPGGWQLAAFHAATGRLFVLMHEGGRWTHKRSGEEVWVHDAADGRLLRRVALPADAQSIAVSQDDRPLLFALTDEASLAVLDATSYAPAGELRDLGYSPHTLSVYGE